MESVIAGVIWPTLICGMKRFNFYFSSSWLLLLQLSARNDLNEMKAVKNVVPFGDISVQVLNVIFNLHFKERYVLFFVIKSYVKLI